MLQCHSLSREVMPYLSFNSRVWQGLCGGPCSECLASFLQSFQRWSVRESRVPSHLTGKGSGQFGYLPSLSSQSCKLAVSYSVAWAVLTRDRMISQTSEGRRSQMVWELSFQGLHLEKKNGYLEYFLSHYLEQMCLACGSPASLQRAKNVDPQALSQYQKVGHP